MHWTEIFFQDWPGIVRTLAITPLAYATLIVFLRLSGKRTLSKFNAFDFVVTIALGSILASMLLQESVALAEGATALGLLILLQYVIAALSVRSKAISSLVTAEPTLLARKGEFCDDALRRSRVTRDDALTAVREAGAHDIEEVSTIILEADGSLSVSLASSK